VRNHDAQRDLSGADDIAKMLTREEWAKKASEIFAWMDIRVVQAIVAAGQDEWLRVARAGFSGQGFRQEDYIEMFFQMRQRVAKAQETAEDMRKGLIGQGRDQGHGIITTSGPAPKRGDDIVLTELDKGAVRVTHG
jgi:hypothetical protein